MTEPVRTAGSGSAADVRAGWARDIILLIVLLGVLFGAGLGTRAFWTPDEGRYVEIPREMVEAGDYVTPRLNGVKYFEKPVLFYWLEAGAIHVFGVREWSMRLWPALFALIGCLAVYAAGRRLYDRRAGLLAATVLATSPLYYFLGRVIILDMAVSVLLTLALLAFLLGVREPLGMSRRLWLWSFYVLAALATLTKGLIGIVIPGLVIGAWIVVLWDWRLLKQVNLPSGIALFLLVAAPWHVLASQANPEFARFYFIHEHFERYLTTVHARYQPSWFFLPVLAAGFFPWIAFLGQSIAGVLPRTWHDRLAHREAVFLVLWVTLVFAFFSFSSSKLIPYVLPVFPPLALLVGRYLSARWEQAFSRGWKGAFVSILLVGGGLALLLTLLSRGLAGHPAVAESVNQMGANFYVIAAALGGLGVAPYLFYRFRGGAAAVVAVAVSAVVLLNVMMLVLPSLDDRRSVKELVLEIKSRLRAGDEVVAYHRYPQDLPVYLGRRVTIAEWKGELEFGMSVEDTRAWMIDEAEFQRRWTGPGRVFLVAGRSDFDQLRVRLGGRFHQIGQVGDNVLAINRENSP